jgi:uncharacterized membrane protein HdeD (DUF308 family)
MNNKSMPSAGRLQLIGYTTIVMGIIALAAPAMTAGTVVLVVGFVMLATGLTQVFQGFRGQSWRDKIMPLMLGFISCVSGILVLAHPLLGLGFLTLLLSTYFVVGGLWKIIAAFKFKPAGSWYWLLLGGLLSLVLGLLIWNQWPLSGVWAIGILVGIDFITTGVAIVVLAMGIKRGASPT